MSGWWGVGAQSSIDSAVSLSSQQKKQNITSPNGIRGSKSNLQSGDVEINELKINSIEDLSTFIQQFAASIHNMERNVKHLLRNYESSNGKNGKSALDTLNNNKDSERLRSKIKVSKDKIQKSRDAIQKGLLRFSKKKMESSSGYDLGSDTDSVAGGLDSSIGGVSSAQKVQFNKLQSQFKELCKQYEKCIQDYRDSEKSMKRSQLFKYGDDDLDAMFSNKNGDKSSAKNGSSNRTKSSSASRNNGDEEEDDDLGQQAQALEQNKFVLSSADQGTLDVEKQIALETNRELKDLETNYYELHQCFVDLNEMVKEQGEGIEVIQQNVQLANEYVEQGVENIKVAKSFTGMGLLQNIFSPGNIIKNLIK